MSRYLVSESVTEGHPDKVADKISDAIVDAYLAKDPDSRVAVETVVKEGLVALEGEISAPVTLNHSEIARNAIAEIGYTDAESGIDPNGAGIINNVWPRDFDSNVGSWGQENADSEEEKQQLFDTFVGDQGLVVGYATDETSEYLPLPYVAATKLAERLAYVRKHGIIPELRPDGKTETIVEYTEDLSKPLSFKAVLISTQHSPEITVEEVRQRVHDEVLVPVLDQFGLDYSNATIVINKTPFVHGGPHSDAGLTGRKIVVDTYGSIGSHGGGAFSGKDPHKADRSEAYAARWAAKNIVAAGLARRVQVTLGFILGQGAPASIDVETYGTESVPRPLIQKAVESVFDFRLLSIIEQLDLERPIYYKTAAYGHFGRNDPDFTWERLDKVQALRDAVLEAAREEGAEVTLPAAKAAGAPVAEAQRVGATA
ncbi:S-adenosylmethionine synthetase [Pseudoscardovia radai]|uniref:Methionine adenosyltransferase n=1 Tax=Pseudoscardovia radai TaxID=987066 RepID=A0A261EZR7_9BIFI|nr:methionine adenosyltransferase [Pseudoscardovia radai]OZG52364.1 S-adenosylmethionine synthetase [Pseudoscardovia radai]